VNAWVFLAIAITLEVAGTFLLKLSDGLEKRLWGMLSIACYCGCFWAGVGIVAAAALGLFVFDEKLGPMQYLLIALVLIGAVGLRLTTKTN